MTTGEMSIATTIPTTPAPAAPAATSADPGAAAGGASSSPAFIDMVPQEYREKPWVQDIAKNEKPFDALFKWGENAQSLIGKKTNGVEIPGEGAAPEAVKAFHKALGVPDSPDGYELAPPDISKEHEEVQKYLGTLKRPEFTAQMKQIAHQAGIPPKAFAALAQAFDAHQIAEVRSIHAATEQAKAQQAETFNKIFGDKADSVRSVAKDMVNKVLPEEVRNTNNPVIALHAALNFINEKLYKNDSVANSNSAVSPQMSKTQLQAKIFELRQRPEYRDEFHAGHKALHEQVDGLYAQMLAKN